jgi:hypothetical protein
MSYFETYSSNLPLKRSHKGKLIRVISCIKIQHTIKHFHFEPRHMGSASLIPAMIPVYLRNILESTICHKFVEDQINFQSIPSLCSIITLISHFEPRPSRKWLAQAFHELRVWYDEFRLTYSARVFFQSSKSHKGQYCCYIKYKSRSKAIYNLFLRIFMVLNFLHHSPRR